MRSVLVCGAGWMGTWIAAAMADAGLNVLIHDPDSEAAEEAAAAYGTSTATSRLCALRELDGRVADVDAVVETVTESLAIKQELFETLESRCSPDAIFATNSSILDPEDVFRGIEPLSRCACLHFYRPSTVAEIAPIPQTGESVIGRLQELARAMGLTPVVMKRWIPGFVVAACLTGLLDAALEVVHEDVVRPADVDEAWRGLTGMSAGPLEILDIIGLDTALRIRQVRQQRQPENERLARGIDVLQRLVRQGRLGMKAGMGFHGYSGAAKRVAPS